jgi:hypothetical protein
MRRLAALLLVALAVPAFAQPALTFDPDTVRAGALDGGKMWLFEDPPTEYLAGTYGFRPDEAWFERARLASLRMPGCSASFVSPHGLVLTNHHCAQGDVVAVDRGGEGLLDGGFTAASLEEERRVPDLYMDQLVAIEDVTAEMAAAVDAAQTAAEREATFDEAEAAVTARLLAPYGITEPDADRDDYVVQTVALYDGGRYSAYVFRRYRDVRLVMAPERAVGYFGGDYDNFTYPRYAADFAFFRIYGDDGRPLDSPHYFTLPEDPGDGVEEGTLVFVIGNPGSTSRGLTVAELEFVRDVTLPSTLAFIDSRAAALQAYLDSGLAPEPDRVRSQLFSLLNAQKAYGGRLRGLSDSYIVARRAAAERDFRAASSEAGALIDRQAAAQAEKRRLGAAYRAFPFLFNARYGSATLRRARAEATGGDAEVEALPDAVERGFLTAEVEALRAYYAEAGQPLPDVLAGASAEAVADRLLSDGAAAVALVQEIEPALAEFQSAAAGLGAEEREVARQLGRERFETFGSAVPPDATFSLRFTDGVVMGYPYNGTIAPPMTSLFGMFDRYHSFCTSGRETAGACDWALPARWLEARDRLDLSTPVNFTSTSDTIGGNSGSPAVTRDLDLVGLNFDRTIEGLVRDYLYAPERGRNVMVDTRLVLEALDGVYGLDGLLDELTGGDLRP